MDTPYAATAPVLSVDNLTIDLPPEADRTDAVQGVSFDIKPGEVLCLLGESSSCVSRLIETTDGRILLGPDEIAKMPARQLRSLRRKVQIAFQDPYRSLNPRRTIGDSIIEGPMNYGATRAAAMTKARSLMELVRLDPDGLDRLSAPILWRPASARVYRSRAGN